MSGHLKVEISSSYLDGNIYPAFVKDVEDNGLLVSFPHDWLPPTSVPFNMIRLPPENVELPYLSANQNVEVRVNAPGISGNYYWRRGKIKFVERFISGSYIISFPLSSVYELYPSSSVRPINKNPEISSDTFKKIEIGIDKNLHDIVKNVGIHNEFVKKVDAEVCFFVPEIESLRIICKGEKFTSVHKKFNLLLPDYLKNLRVLKSKLFVDKDLIEEPDDFDLICPCKSSSETVNFFTPDIISQKVEKSESSSLNPTVNLAHSNRCKKKNLFLRFTEKFIPTKKTPNRTETNFSDQFSESLEISEANSSVSIGAPKLMESPDQSNNGVSSNADLVFVTQNEQSLNSENHDECNSFDDGSSTVKLSVCSDMEHGEHNSDASFSSTHDKSTSCKTSFSEKFTVPKRLIGLAFGKHGKNLIAARNLPGVKKVRFNRNTRYFRIKGSTEEAVKAARKKLEYCEIDMIIDGVHAEMLLKNNRQKLKEIVEKTKLTRLFVDGKKSSSVQNGFIFTLVGKMDYVFDAKAYLQYESYVLNYVCKERSAGLKRTNHSDLK